MDGRARRAAGSGPAHRNAAAIGLKHKDLIGIPWRLALALQADGWYLRQDIIWHKPNPMPESCRDRCTKAHEYIFLLTKKPRYFCDMEAVKEPARTAGQIGGLGGTAAKGRAFDREPSGNEKPEAGKNYVRPNKRNKRSVWTIATAPYKEAHFATFPPKLIEPCVLAGTSAKGACPECGKPWVRVVERKFMPQEDVGETKGVRGHDGQKPMDDSNSWAGTSRGSTAATTTGWQPGCECHGHFVDTPFVPEFPERTYKRYVEDSPTPESIPCIVFDPFMGSGTTGMVAKQHGRDYLGIELNPEYIELINKRIATALPEPLPLLEMRKEQSK